MNSESRPSDERCQPADIDAEETQGIFHPELSGPITFSNVGFCYL
jgi:hypothetical protein